jgi:FkbM family methyltransferase
MACADYCARSVSTELSNNGPPDPDKPALTYSLHGEDQAIIRTLERNGRYRDRGFYIDVGAFHPYWSSNTALLHARGWRGINVEPNPVMAHQLSIVRPDDITLACAVGSPRRTAELHYFYDWASSNTLVSEFADMISHGQNVEVSKRIPVEVIPLADLCTEHVPPGQTIDFLNVDVEGMDVEVLESGDWDRFHPTLVAVEDLDLDLGAVEASASYRFMRDHGYRLTSHAVLTSIYLRAS